MNLRHPSRGGAARWSQCEKSGAVHVRLCVGYRKGITMEQLTLDVFSTATNCGIVRMPGRRFPGTVVQGDTLSILWTHAHNVLHHARQGGNPDLADAAEFLAEILNDFVAHYEHVMAEHRLELPYQGPLASDVDDGRDG